MSHSLPSDKLDFSKEENTKSLTPKNTSYTILGQSGNQVMMLKLRKTDGYLQHVLVGCQDKRFASQGEGHIGHLGDLGAVDEVLDKKKKT